MPERAVAPSPGAERMRRCRERRRRGLRCLSIDLRDTEIEALIRRGFLRIGDRSDDGAVKQALYRFLDRAL